MKKKLADMVYDNIIDEVLKRIPDEDKEIVSIRFKEFISNSMRDNYDPPEMLVEMLTDSYRKSYAEQISPDELRNLLLIDDNYNKLYNLRAEIAKKLDDDVTINEEDYKNYVEKIKTLSENVRDYNKKYMEQFTGNMLIDLDFLAGKSKDISEDNMSLFWRGKAERLIKWECK